MPTTRRTRSTTPSRSDPDRATFYSGLRDYEAAYHNHKETLAWLGVAAYILGAVAVATSKASGLGPTLAVFAAMLVVLAYTRRQFNLRLYASWVVSASARLAALALADGEDDPLAPKEAKSAERSGTSEPVAKSWFRRSLSWLRRIRPVLLVVPERLSPNLNDDVLPRSVIERMQQLQRLHDNGSRRTEGSSESLEMGAYAIMVFVTVATMLVTARVL